MASQATKFKLNTGAQIPAVGFGTWQDKDAQESAVEIALKAGYRHIDTARVYGTESAVARGIRASGVPRGEIFITTKLWNNSHHPDDVEPALDASLKDLGTDYVDLYLMHWPSPFARSDDLFPKQGDKIQTGTTDFVDTWRALESVFRSGKARAIGISNFSRAELVRLLESASVVPAVHQLELHPWLQQHDFCALHDQKDIHVTQYSPLGNQNPIYGSGEAGSGKLMDDPALVEVGRKYNKTGAQAALAWAIAHGRSVIPKSKTEARIRQNLEADFKLDEADVAKIDRVDRKMRFNDPTESFGWDFFTDLDGKSGR